MSTIDSFLAHYGVKGMKWGVRRESSGSTSRSSASSRDKAAQRAQLRSRAAFAGKEAFKLSVVPALTISGAGVPIALAAGATIRILDTQASKEAISAAAAYSKIVAQDWQNTTMSTIAKTPKTLDIKRLKGSG